MKEIKNIVSKKKIDTKNNASEITFAGGTAQRMYTIQRKEDNRKVGRSRKTIEEKNERTRRKSGREGIIIPPQNPKPLVVFPSQDHCRCAAAAVVVASSAVMMEGMHTAKEELHLMAESARPVPGVERGACARWRGRLPSPVDRNSELITHTHTHTQTLTYTYRE